MSFAVDGTEKWKWSFFPRVCNQPRRSLEPLKGWCTQILPKIKLTFSEVEGQVGLTESNICM